MPNFSDRGKGDSKFSIKMLFLETFKIITEISTIAHSNGNFALKNFTTFTTFSIFKKLQSQKYVLYSYITHFKVVINFLNIILDILLKI